MVGQRGHNLPTFENLLFRGYVIRTSFHVGLSFGGLVLWTGLWVLQRVYKYTLIYISPLGQ